MSTLSALNTSIATPANLTPSQKKQGLSAFDVNAKQFGPVAASAIGVAQVAGGAAHAGYSFSAEALKRLQDAGDALGDAADAAWEGTKATFHEAVDGIEHGLSSAVDEVAEFGSDLKAAVNKVYDVGHSFEQSVVSTVEDAASTVGDALGAVADGVSDAVNTVTDYVSLGLAAFK